MKKTLILCAALSTLAASQLARADEELAKKNNCLACHTVEKKILGPSFNDIAAKYKDDAEAAATLVDKVRNGGSGVWGPVPMPPNPLVSEADAKTLVDWILTL